MHSKHAAFFLSFLLLILFFTGWSWNEQREKIRGYKLDQRVYLHEELIELSRTLDQLEKTMHFFKEDFANEENVIFQELALQNTRRLENIGSKIDRITKRMDTNDQLGTTGERIRVITHSMNERLSKFFDRSDIAVSEMDALREILKTDLEEFHHIVWNRNSEQIVKSETQEKILKRLEILDRRLTEKIGK